MYLPVTDLRGQRTPEPPAMVSVVSRSDVMWNRPLFKAPPLVLDPQKFNARSFTEDFRRELRTQR